MNTDETKQDAATPVPPRDLLGRLPWLRSLPTTQELKQLKYESTWNPAAAEQLKGLVQELTALKAACDADSHYLFNPTHIMERGEEIVGCASIGAMPMVNVWMHSKKIRNRESAGLMNMVENAAWQSGFKTIALPCWKHSPLRPFMESAGGYSYFGETGLFIKDLNRRKANT